MGGRGGESPPRRRSKPTPLPLEPVDLLAGLAPGLELTADGVPPEVGPDEPPGPAEVSVAEVGKMLRSEDPTVRRLIRTAELRPRGAGDAGSPGTADLYQRPNPRRRPGE
jgi:hypothetical protein